MKPDRPKLIFWTGPKHSGKTTATFELVQKVRSAGFTVAGLLAPSVHDQDRLIGFDAVDLHTSHRAVLTRIGAEGTQQIGAFTFLHEGIAFGHEVLTRPAALTADLVIVDEFGPLELGGEGWRDDVEALLSDAAGLLLLVVRDRLIRKVADLYPDKTWVVISATRPGGADAVIGILQARTKPQPS